MPAATAVGEQTCDVISVLVAAFVRLRPSALSLAGVMAFRATRPFDGSQTPRLPTYAASIDMSFVNCRWSATFHWLMRAGRPASGLLYNPPHTLEKLFNWPATVFTPGVKFRSEERRVGKE